MIASGCGAVVVPDAGDSSSTGAATTSTQSSTTASVASSSDGSASGTGSSSAGEDQGDGVLPKYDVPATDVGPTIATCEVGDAEEVDLVITTPDGPFVATHAWWGWENCCIIDPWLLLSEGDTLHYEDGKLVTPHLEILLPGTWEHTGAYLGAMPVTVGFDIWSTSASFDAGAELLEPLDPDGPHDRSAPDLSASFMVDGEGWSIQGTVRAPHCVLAETMPCPCE